MKRFRDVMFGVLATAMVAVPLVAQTDTTRRDYPGYGQRADDRGTGFDYGWLGLIGLAGLAGLRGRGSEYRVDRTGTYPQTHPSR